MNNEPVPGNLYETVVDKKDNVWGDKVEFSYGTRKKAIGRILWILATGGAMMKVIVEVVRLVK